MNPKGVEFDTFKNDAGTNAFFSITYASEADLINTVLLGKTAKQWRDSNPNELEVSNLPGIEKK